MQTLLCLLSDLVMTVEYTHTFLNEYGARHQLDISLIVIQNLKLVVKSVTYMKSCMTRVYLLIIGWFVLSHQGKGLTLTSTLTKGLNRNSKFRRGRRATRWTKCIQGRVRARDDSNFRDLPPQRFMEICGVRLAGVGFETQLDLSG